MLFIKHCYAECEKQMISGYKFSVTHTFHEISVFPDSPRAYSIHEEIKIRLKSGNACCHSVQTLMSYSLLPKNLNINRTIICLLCCTSVKLGRSHRGGNVG
jgi:hypothetical protein